MLYLDILLFLNLFLAFKIFRNLIAPPVLVGAGMCGATVIASFYSIEWGLNRMLPESILILGGGPLLFTLLCFVLLHIGQGFSFPAVRKKLVSEEFNLYKLTKFYLFIDFFVAFLIVAKFLYMRSVFGGLPLAELIYATRIDNWTGDNLLKYPKFITYGVTFSLLTSYFTYYLLAALIVGKESAKYKRLYYLLWVHVVLLVLNGFSGGDKGSGLEPIILFVLMFLVIFYSYRRSFRLDAKIYVKILLAFLIMASFFKGLSEVLGRETDNYRNNTDMLAEYMGAEIKNFDIYMNHKDGNAKSKGFGDKTFNGLFQELNPKREVSNGVFQSYKDYSLGNVYTQYYYWHADFGLIGIVVLTIFVAIISMFFYKNGVLDTISKQRSLSPSLCIYLSMAFPLFMTFFSSKFTETVIVLNFLKLAFYIFVFVYLFNRFFKLKNNGKKNMCFGLLP